MRLSQVLKILPTSSYQILGSVNKEVKDICDDSRIIKKGDVYVAIAGLTYDGHSFIREIIKKGIEVVVLSNKDYIEKDKTGKITYVIVKDTRNALSLLSSSINNNPSKKLKVIGVTGTDGKTSTVNLIYHILNYAKKRVGMISTINAKIGRKSIDTGIHVTNPGAIALQKLLVDMVNKKIKYVVLETTSHGIDQHRIDGINYDISVLTNITPEHLDYHRTFKNYRDTKYELFKRSSCRVLNMDDSSYSIFIKRLNNRNIISYSLKIINADYYTSNITETIEGMTFDLNYLGKKYSFKTKLTGLFNVSNILAAIAVARYYKIDFRTVRKALNTFDRPKGRLNIIKNNLGITTIVDYAHTPNALEQVLSSLYNIKGNGKLIALIGAEGQRDPGKRYPMGKISAKYADITVITAVDPRDQSLSEIDKEIMKGCEEGGAVKLPEGYKRENNIKYFQEIPDRGEAIYRAINKLARKDDIVVVCGKGHEEGLNLGGIEYQWSDFDAVKLATQGKVYTINKSL